MPVQLPYYLRQVSHELVDFNLMEIPEILVLKVKFLMNLWISIHLTSLILYSKNVKFLMNLWISISVVTPKTSASLSSFS